MSDLKVVLYKENHVPRSFDLSTKSLYKVLLLASVCGFALFFSVVLLLKTYLWDKTLVPKIANTLLLKIPTSDVSAPKGSIEEKNAILQDEVEALKIRLKNQAVVESSPKAIDKTSPALALFSPNILDKTKDQSVVAIQNFKLTQITTKPSKTELSFELHNTLGSDSIQKGYVIVLAQTVNQLRSYPDVFNSGGSYLLDFEKGETFQVARFRIVNTQFQFEEQENPHRFQILIFTRVGELLINYGYEVSKNGNE